MVQLNAIPDNFAEQVAAGSTDNCGIVSYSLARSVFDCTDGGDRPVTVTVTDAAGNSNQCSTYIFVNDGIAPTAVCYETYTVSLNNSGAASLTARDLDNGSTDNCGPVSLYLDRTSFDCEDIGMVQANLFVIDASNNRDTCQTNVQVFDVDGPQIDCYVDYAVSLDVNGLATVLPEDVIFHANDNCTPFLGLQFKLMVETGDGAFTTVNRLDLDCNEIGSQVIGGFVIDAYANTSSTCEVNLTVGDYYGICADCEPSLSLSGDISGGGYRASESIESDGTVQMGTAVHFRAGNSIRLTPGFHAEAGSDFTARIEDCETAVAATAGSIESPIPIETSPAMPPTDGFQFGLFPNPFTRQFTLQYKVVEATEIEIRLISIDGSVRQQLLPPQLHAAGSHELEWNGMKLAAGIYIVQLRLGDAWHSRKIVKMR